MKITCGLDLSIEFAQLTATKAVEKSALSLVVPRFEAVEDGTFWAFVEPEGDGFVLQISTGLAKQTEQLWTVAYTDDVFLSGVGHPVGADAEQMAHLSLTWLIQHELHHIILNHFDLVGRFRISETRNAPRFDLTRQSKIKPAPLVILPPELRPHAPLCLELQADHDAAEMVLGAYSSDDWVNLRHRVTAISAMMMLIEREDARNGETGITHPKAATRIFQLLGHVTEMPLISAQVQARLKGFTAVDPADFPPDAEIKAFGRQVTLPSFFDAVALARIAGADSIRDDLGEPEDFFRDIQVAKAADPSRFADLKTAGAKQWAELVLKNEDLKHFQNLPTGLDATEPTS
ncbi:hypothetical protein [Phaeobacter inhibens]|uniref:hypothetical protein n=1 Tax=Phaeobacter inhibens TaxID=221822 RepID=UPI0021A8514F|nr:hypothetical protein [Phaeobacter inhibens]UWR57092.1 hypothetical protein K4F89_01135 [Phaeobacter inhibens]